MNVGFAPLPFPSTTELEQIRAIYEVNFEPAKRKCFETIAAGIENGKYHCVIARRLDENKQIVAFAFLLPLPGETAVFLEYIAVDGRLHSQGIGSGLLRHLFENRVATSVVWEVEPPENEAPNSENNRRICFYHRLGGEVLERSTGYMMPNFSAGSGGVPLLLMQTPLTDQPNEKRIAALIQGIYAAAYPEWTELCNEILANLLSSSSEKFIRSKN